MQLPTLLQIGATAIGLLAIGQTSLLAQPVSQTPAYPITPVAARVRSDFIIIPDLPPIGPVLPIIHDIWLELRLSERRLYVHQREKETKTYPVAVGRPGWETPVGHFEVIRLVKDPIWVVPDIIDPATGRRREDAGQSIPPGPDNPLGDRWIGFVMLAGNNTIGFHGTPNPESIGQAASHGCVRMYNEDIRELFEMVQMGTPVVVNP